MSVEQTPNKPKYVIVALHDSVPQEIFSKDKRGLVINPAHADVSTQLNLPLAPSRRASASIYGLAMRGNTSSIGQTDEHFDRTRDPASSVTNQLGLDLSERFTPAASPFVGIEAIRPAPDWVLRRFFIDRYQTAYRTLSQYLENVPTKEDTDDGGRKRVLYAREEVERRLIVAGYGRKLDLPRVDRKTKQYINPEGRVFVSARYLRKEYQVSSRDLERYLTDVPSIGGISARGDGGVLFDQAEAAKALIPLMELRLLLPKADRKTKKYTDASKEEWWIERSICREYGIKLETLRTITEERNGRWIEGRDAGGRKGRLYNVAHTRIIINEYLALPKIDGVSGEYADDEGTSWVTRNYFNSRYGIHARVIYSCLNEIPSIPGRTLGGRVPLYDKERLRIVLISKGYLLEEISADNESGSTYVKVKGKRERRITDISSEGFISLFTSLPQQEAFQVADRYWEYVKSYPDTKMDIPEYYAKVYLIP